jgi:WS/DGAT/MGAT family acyltransferase
MTSQHINSETFSSVEAAWFRMDKPTNPSAITSVILFEESPDYTNLVNTIENRLLAHPRFRMRVRPPNIPFGLPTWENDPSFDIENHIQCVELNTPGDHKALETLVGELMSVQLDKSRPLWKFYFIEQFGKGSVLICRIHQSIADCLSLMQALLATTDIAELPPTPITVESGKVRSDWIKRFINPAAQVVDTVEETWRAAGNLLHESMELLVHPSRLVDAAGAGKNVSMALGKLLLIGPDRKTSLRGKCDISKRAIWSQALSLESAKSVGGMMGGTVNDVLLCALTGALRRYLESQGERIDGLNIRSIIPVSLGTTDNLDLSGNRFGLVFLSLPIGIGDHLQRLTVIRRRMQAIKRSPEAVVALGILGAVGMSPAQVEKTIVNIFGMKGSAVITNVPGPRQPLFMAGSKISDLVFWIPTPGNLGLGISFISYAGKITLGITSDQGLIPDPETILDYFYQEFAQMQRWGRPPN